MNEDKSTRYQRHRRRALTAGAIAGDLLLAWLAFGGAAIRLRESVQTGLSTLLPSGSDAAATVVVLALIVVALVHLAELPFAWYHGFILEHRYGLSTQSASGWLRDHAKAGLLSGVLVAAGASIVFASLRMWPDRWWAVSAAVFSVALVGAVHLMPTVLLPLFYRIRPLDRPALVARITALAARARTNVVGVFEWVLSGHTKKANAALAGLGSTRRILVSDTLLADFSDDEIEVVLAHELAHHVHRDMWRGIAVSVLVVFAGFFVADVVLRAIGGQLGLAGRSDPASIPLLVLIGRVWMTLALPAVYAVSRAQERAADRYALEATRNPDAFVSAMRRISQQNMAEDEPPRLVRVLFSSHPTVRERIAAARTFTRT